MMGDNHISSEFQKLEVAVSGVGTWKTCEFFPAVGDDHAPLKKNPPKADQEDKSGLISLLSLVLAFAGFQIACQTAVTAICRMKLQK